MGTDLNSALQHKILKDLIRDSIVFLYEVQDVGTSFDDGILHVIVMPRVSLPGHVLDRNAPVD